MNVCGSRISNRIHEYRFRLNGELELSTPQKCVNHQADSSDALFICILAKMLAIVFLTVLTDIILPPYSLFSQSGTSLYEAPHAMISAICFSRAVRFTSGFMPVNFEI